MRPIRLLLPFSHDITTTVKTTIHIALVLTLWSLLSEEERSGVGTELRQFALSTGLVTWAKLLFPPSPPFPHFCIIFITIVAREREWMGWLAE